jgi:hypothetical protein
MYDKGSQNEAVNYRMPTQSRGSMAMVLSTSIGVGSGGVRDRVVRPEDFLFDTDVMTTALLVFVFSFPWVASWIRHDNQANHIIVLSWSTSSFHCMLWFCSRNSMVRVSQRSMFSGLTKSIAIFMQSAKLHTWHAFPG